MTRFIRSMILIVMATLSTQWRAEGQTAPKMTIDVPQEIAGSAASQATLLVESAQPLPATGRITIDPLPGFVVQPATFDVPIGVTNFRKTLAILQDENRSPRQGEHRLQIHLDSLNASHRYQAQAAGKFHYREQISVPAYLLLALLGTAFGYLVRFTINILKSIPPPPAAPDGVPVGPITDWIKSHYYAVDLAVTVAIALLVLTPLVEDGGPPAGASTWYAALLSVPDWAFSRIANY